MYKVEKSKYFKNLELQSENHTEEIDKIIKEMVKQKEKEELKNIEPYLILEIDDTIKDEQKALEQAYIKTITKIMNSEHYLILDKWIKMLLKYENFLLKCKKHYKQDPTDKVKYPKLNKIITTGFNKILEFMIKNKMDYNSFDYFMCEEHFNLVKFYVSNKNIDENTKTVFLRQFKKFADETYPELYMFAWYFFPRFKYKYDSFISPAFPPKNL